MKYQIYLNKETSELLNGIAKAMGQKPSTFIKGFLESCFREPQNVLGKENLEAVKEYGRK